MNVCWMSGQVMIEDVAGFTTGPALYQHQDCNWTMDQSTAAHDTLGTRGSPPTSNISWVGVTHHHHAQGLYTYHTTTST